MALATEPTLPSYRGSTKTTFSFIEFFLSDRSDPGIEHPGEEHEHEEGDYQLNCQEIFACSIHVQPVEEISVQAHCRNLNHPEKYRLSLKKSFSLSEILSLGDPQWHEACNLCGDPQIMHHIYHFTRWLVNLWSLLCQHAGARGLDHDS